LFGETNRMTENPHQTAELTDDELLAQLLDCLSDQAREQGSADLDSACKRHPQVAEELRWLWGAAMLADAVGSQVAHETMAPESASTQLDEPSSSLFELPHQLGDYELQEELGRGGMGVVYKARQISLDRTVAVKMILRGQLASREEEQRFRAEAEAAAKLNHPHVTPVYEVNEHERRLFFSMKYVAGDTLADLLAEGPLPPRVAAELLEKVARAIHYAHEEGVLHRDLKPSNILIDYDGEPHVTDFGLAKRIVGADTLTKTGAVLGTPAYMAPEQASGDRGRVGPASDGYSLGCILYHMLTGRPPFQAATTFDTLLMVLEQDPPLPHVVQPTADRDLEMICLRCLQKPADLRYESVDKLADDLLAYLNDESISARSGRFAHIIARAFRETHHAPVLENWGLLWMWHSLVVLGVSLTTNAMSLWGVQNRWYYIAMWTVVFWVWAGVFWNLRRRMGPVLFVERQIAHVWASGVLAIGMLFPIELLIAPDKPVLYLSPILALAVGMQFLVKAGILSGVFYVQAAVLFATSLVMAWVPQFAHAIFGVVAAGCFFIPGLKYYRQRMRGRRG
jgi:serine/threonine-protein kinase